MQFSSVYINKMNMLSARCDHQINHSHMDSASITENGAPVNITGRVMHDDRKGFDLYICRDFELGSDTKIYCRDFAEAPVRIGYSLYDTDAFEFKYFYGGTLGAIYSNEATVFRLWSPAASRVTLLLQENLGSHDFTEIDLVKGPTGVFSITIEKDLHGALYKYRVYVEGRVNICVDPYARATTENGSSGVVVNLNRTNPYGYQYGRHILTQSPTDAVVYEIHVRDLTISETSGVKYKGKFRGFAEEGTVSPQGELTGLDHIKEMGVTHVHLMPIMDYASVDESQTVNSAYNWGYDPGSYFVPDGVYCINPFDAISCVTDFKTLVHALHKNNIGVILDVVYNHTYFTEESPFNLVMPDYYYRKKKGRFTNGSGCGNELDSERGMVRKLMVDSLLYWVNEYGVDGFRFDLMGLHDIKTMNYIRHKLDEIDSRIIIYGEGWSGGPSSLAGEAAATKYNAYKLDDRIAFFNDDMRDGIKGSCFDAGRKGYLGGSLDPHYNSGFNEIIKSGIVGAIDHPHVMYQDGKFPFAKRPTQTVTYESSHDNYTLFDKLTLANPNLSEEELIKLNKLAAVLVLTSQGIPFLHGGEEFLRQKIRPDGTFEHNSYNSPDSVNALNWERKHKYRDVVNYYKGLIELRKAHKGFRMTTAEDVEKFLRFLYTQPENRICFRINAGSVGDRINKIAVMINPTNEPFDCRASYREDVDQTVFRGWQVYVDGKRAGNRPLYPIMGDTVTVPPLSAIVMMK